MSSPQVDPKLEAVRLEVAYQLTAMALSAAGHSREMPIRGGTNGAAEVVSDLFGRFLAQVRDEKVVSGESLVSGGPVAFGQAASGPGV